MKARSQPSGSPTRSDLSSRTRAAALSHPSAPSSGSDDTVSPMRPMTEVMSRAILSSSPAVSETMAGAGMEPTPTQSPDRDAAAWQTDAARSTTLAAAMDPPPMPCLFPCL